MVDVINCWDHSGEIWCPRAREEKRSILEDLPDAEDGRERRETATWRRLEWWEGQGPCVR